jgi:8-oxo-dGTP pyrophosphatase MutT (NUDIX family)
VGAPRQRRRRWQPGYGDEVSAQPLPTPVQGRRLPAVEERSAGGIVVDIKDGCALIAIIARRNRAGRIEWCLPKGHVEPGETLVETAAREVAEETGIVGRVLVELGTIDYWFATSTKRVHKYVHHYLLEALGGELSIENDPDHEAIDVAWLPLREAHEHLTFPNERRIARQAWHRLAGDG